MKAAIALLSDYQIQNMARRMVYELTQFGKVELLGSLLPAHVSLKQPFTFENMETLEGWFDLFSQRVAPLLIEFDHIYYDGWDKYAIVGMHVIETPMLRGLHNQINHELKDVVRDPTAPFDGDPYRFHLTIELGEVSDPNPYIRYYDSLPEKQIDASFLAEHIALFFYQDGPIGLGTFNCYKVLPLTG
jgi:hypothetical protein